MPTRWPVSVNSISTGCPTRPAASGCWSSQAIIFRLVAQGFEVRLHRAVPVQPLDPGLVTADEDNLSWLTARLTAPGEG